ncbi:acdf10f8-6bb7-49a3-b21c-78369dfb452f-CDS [Sclerotinia trifoliorum]|uniref:Acdf10f8-6bb7-49a3-b21c-78369dfb452f-CDS n=1 Tax=Sclerotinia trifoliorum TaxID=28548 RepID=A0A8H2VQH1_9HELO|nr:acdf10f8-6bb7-49a3-b21c-78369dfb452f-CDS [Sclerotinia trifoliorum]
MNSIEARSSTQVSYPLSPPQIYHDSNPTTMQNIPLELFEVIWEMADTGVPRNVPVSCRHVGDTFEIYSAKVTSNITALSVHWRSRQWAKTENNVAKLLRRKGYKGPLDQIRSLYFNPRRDRICPVNEMLWTPKAFELLLWVMNATGLKRVAVSDCSHLTANLNNPWELFFWWSNTEKWSSTFREISMYTTKFNIDVKQRTTFVGWAGVDLELSLHQKQRRNLQILKSRIASRKIQDAREKQALADDIAEKERKTRTKLDEVPTWLYESLHETGDFNLRMMVEVGSLDPRAQNVIDDTSDDDDSDDDDNSDDSNDANNLNDESEEKTDIDEEPEEDDVTPSNIFRIT